MVNPFPWLSIGFSRDLSHLGGIYMILAYISYIWSIAGWQTISNPNRYDQLPPGYLTYGNYI